MTKPLRLLAALAVALPLLACNSQEEGTRVTLALAHAPSGAAQVNGEQRGFTNSSGAVVLAQGFVTVTSVELFACPSLASKVWRLLSPIGVAYAHSTGSPTKLGEPHVDALSRADGEALELGELAPPPGRYCRARLVFGPADDDAVGLPATPDLVGASALLQGQLTPTGSQSPTAFALEPTTTAGVDVDLPQVEVEVNAPVTLTFTLAYDRWLEGVDVNAPTAAAKALEAISHSASVTVR